MDEELGGDIAMASAIDISKDTSIRASSGDLHGCLLVENCPERS